jgi:hypothetical protein
VDRGEHDRGRGARAGAAHARIIVAGMLAIVFLYVGANVGYFYALPVEAMAGDGGRRAAAHHVRSARSAGRDLIAGAILCSVFGALNGNILAKPRVAYALARDGLTFSALGRVHPRWATPHVAIVVHALGAVLLVALLRDFDRLTTYFHRRGVGGAAVRGGRGPRAAPEVAGRAPARSARPAIPGRRSSSSSGRWRA